MEQLDSMYTTRLHAVTSKDGKPGEEERPSQRFRRIIGSIVVLRDALAAAALTERRYAKELEVKQTLRSPGTVLRHSGGHSSPITLLPPHLSVAFYWKTGNANPVRGRRRKHTPRPRSEVSRADGKKPTTDICSQLTGEYA